MSDAENDTLRAHLEAIRDRMSEAVQDGHWLNPLPMRFRYVPDPLPACSSASTPPHTHKETT